jgi:hypothetical protein
VRVRVRVFCITPQAWTPEFSGESMGSSSAVVCVCVPGAVYPFQNLLDPAQFDCFREKKHSISNGQAPSAGAAAELWKGSIRAGAESCDGVF